MENAGEMYIYWRELEFVKLFKFNILEISNVNITVLGQKRRWICSSAYSISNQRTQIPESFKVHDKAVWFLEVSYRQMTFSQCLNFKSLKCNSLWQFALNESQRWWMACPYSRNWSEMLFQSSWAIWVSAGEKFFSTVFVHHPGWFLSHRKFDFIDQNLTVASSFVRVILALSHVVP